MAGMELESRIAALLRETEAAHGAYETEILGGNRDADWAGWYAAHLLDRGIAQFVPELGSQGDEGLAATLAQLDADFRREQPDTDWPQFYARRLIAVAP